MIEKMSTMSSPLYSMSPVDIKDGYEGEHTLNQDALHMEEDSEDEFIDVDDSHPPKFSNYNGDMEAEEREVTSSGEESSVKSPDSAKKNSEKKLYRCQHCKYVTDRKNNLKRHVVTMHEQCQKTLECCDIVFQNKASLRDHVLSCHRNGYDCRICGRNFCRKALLKRHITVHSGQKDYICSVCGYATSHKSNLDRHKRRHGPKYPMDGSKYRIPESIDISAVKSLSPSSLSSSPPPLPKCHAFSIERLVSDDYHPRRGLFHDTTTSPIPPHFYTFDATVTQEARHTICNAPPKKRHLNARYLFTKRLLCTHSKHGSDQNAEQDESTPYQNRINTQTVPASTMELESNSKITRLDSLQRNKGLLLSSKRLFPALYHCKICNITFENQVEMGDHFRRIKHEELTPSPQRPLTIQARQKDTRYIY